MSNRLILALILTFALASCSHEQQYVYNCTSSTVRFDGVRMLSKSYFAHESGLPPFTVHDSARYSDGSSHAPTRVKQHQIRGSEHGNRWAEVSNVCPQFEGRVVILDLE